MFRRAFNSKYAPCAFSLVPIFSLNKESHMDAGQASVISAPFKLNTTSTKEEDVSIISGRSNKVLSNKVVSHLKRSLADVDMDTFSDGEISINIKESMRGKHVFIIQSCAPPVNSTVMELLLSVAAAKRSGASSVTAVVPYYGYKLNRRGLPISTTHHSRFLWSAAADIAKMLSEMGVDKVVSVDLQRPGQGQEACFFPATLPAETITTNKLFVDYFHKTLDTTPLVFVSPNTELVKKARKFKESMMRNRPSQSVECAVFLRTDSDISYLKGAALELKGDVRGKDVILIEDYIDSAMHLSILCNRLLKEGANKVTICASHALFDENALKLIELSPVEKVIITDSLALPTSYEDGHSKIVQLSIAPLLANVIASDISYTLTSEFNPDDEEDSFVQE